jgi:hypothetical protein
MVESSGCIPKGVPLPRVVHRSSGEGRPPFCRSWDFVGQRGGSEPMGAVPEHGEAPRDLPGAREVE